jgi:PAS domain S-box-containing protein
MTLKCLVIEPDPANLQFLHEQISRTDSEIVPATDLATAPELTLRSVPDLIFLECSQDPAGARKYLKWLRSESPLRHSAYVLLLIQPKNAVDLHALIEEGGDDFQLQPCDPIVLSAKITLALKRCGHDREFREMKDDLDDSQDLHRQLKENTSHIITQSRKTEEFLLLLDAAIFALEEGVVITDSSVDLPGPCIIYANQAQAGMTGYTIEEMIGHTPRIFQGPKTDRLLLDQLRNCLTTGISFEGEMINYRKDGSEYLVRLTVSPVRDKNGAITHFISIQRDATHHRREQEELMQSRKLHAIGELAGGIAHEFNNLLSPMLIQAESIETNFGDIPTLKEELEPIHQAIEQATQLCSRILLLGRRSGETRSVVSINQIVIDTIQLLKKTIDRRIEIVQELDETLPPMLLPRSMILQVLINLTLNARDALVEKLLALQTKTDPWIPRITIKTGHTAADPNHISGGTEADAMFYLRVSDNGTGMNEETKRRLFEPFYTTKGPTVGTGLGMAVVWSIVQSLEGRLEVESQPSEGCTFIVHLPKPLDTPQPPVIEPKKNTTALLPYLAPSVCRLLLVDDNHLLVQTYTRLLSKAGHSVTATRDAKEAIQIVQHDPEAFDLVITDLNLPQLSGYQLIREIRESGCKAKVVMISGYLNTEEGIFPEVEKADTVLAKPISPELLLQTIARVCART